MTEKETEKPQSRFLKISARKQAAPLARYSMVDLKFTLETAISDVLVYDFNYVQDHTFMNRHLVLGYIAAIASIASAAYSYTHPFEEPLTKQIIFVGCSIYFLFVNVLLIHNKFIRGDIVFVGTKKSSPTEKITIKLSTSKYSDKVVIKAIKEANGKKSFSELDNSVGKWFTELGHFAPEHFLEDFSRLLSGKTKKNQ
ncbi:signal peptidase complex subunit 2 [Globomyces pollinis-pini]|nr:signal peptidase complex subunit 2 [Globomyces pollinis-pini]